MKKEYRFYVYIMANYERTTLYIGFTNDIVRRIIEHRNGFGSAFTSKYNLGFLLYYEEYGYVNDAIGREKELKKWRREKKEALIAMNNPNKIDLSENLFDSLDLSKEEIDEQAEYLKKLYNK